MDKEYMENCTSNWMKIDGNDVVELWEYFDKVYWETHYAIKINGEVKVAALEGSHITPYGVFRVVKQCFDK